MIVLDTSFVVALLNGKDADHREAAGFYENASGGFATTPLVLAEIDHLLHSRATPPVIEAFHLEIGAGSLGVEWWSQLDAQAAEIASRYVDLGLGLTDASLIALAAKLETRRIASFDERHFRAVKPLAGASSFELLPADAE